jgi:phosphoribosylformylglycinamidine synthase
MITSFFRRSRLWETEEDLWLAALQRKVSPDITKVEVERRFLIDSTRSLEDEELNKLKWLLTETFEPEMFKEQSTLQKNILEVGPRLVIVTPESTNAVSICSACGLDSIKRIEQTRLFSISLENGSDLSTKQRQKVYGFIYDRMTEQPYLETPRSFDQDIRPKPVRLIRLLESGIDVLKDANEKLGLAVKGGAKPRRVCRRRETAALPSNFCENDRFSLLRKQRLQRSFSAERKGSVQGHGRMDTNQAASFEGRSQ